MMRKEMSLTPNIKMKQLQWDKLPHQQVSRTLWKDDEPQKERLMLEKLKIDGVWNEMEEDFKAKQLVINLMARQKRAELKSVLDPQTRKRVEILIQRVRKIEPEEIARRIQQFDQDICTPVFLSELKSILPTADQIGKLSIYRNVPSEELVELHPSDRLMVRLIQIDRLKQRIEGMLYRVAFAETWSLLNDSAKKLFEAGKALLDAKQFKELLSLILLIGNYMNGTGIKGGAFGFRVSSINKLVDTKSVNNTTLLHFLEKTVSKHFPYIEEFLDELERPAEAYRVNLQDVRKGLSELQEGLSHIRQELAQYFSDPETNDQYATQMWAFTGNAKEQLEDLVDDVRSAETTFVEAIGYYGEEDKNMPTSEFYGIFKIFVTSYRKCKADNQAALEEKLATEKRKQAMEENRVQRLKAQENSTVDEESNVVLDNLLQMLRNGESIRKGKKQNRQGKPRPSAPAILNTEGGDQIGDTADLARDMLVQLQLHGFPIPPLTSSQRRERRRRERPLLHPEREIPPSPLSVEILDINEDSASEAQASDDPAP